MGECVSVQAKLVSNSGSLPWSSGPTVVMRAPRQRPRHWCTSVWEGGTVSSSVSTRDRVGSTYPRYMGPLESTIRARECRAQVCQHNTAQPHSRLNTHTVL